MTSRAAPSTPSSASILTAIMLFPLYWMINVSLTQPTELRKDPPNLFPFNPTFDGLRRPSSASSCRTWAPA